MASRIRFLPTMGKVCNGACVGLIPAFNEQDRIGGVIEETTPYVDKLFVCDDGSSDGTIRVASDLGAEVLAHGRNLGYGATLRTLFMKALEIKAAVAVTIDADAQHNPKLIPNLIQPIKEDRADIVIGSRFLEKRLPMPTKRLLGVILVTKLTQLAIRRKISDSQCGMRAYSNKALGCVLPLEHGMGASLEILLAACRNGLRIEEVAAEVRYNGESDSSEHPLGHLANLLYTLSKAGLLSVHARKSESVPLDLFRSS